VGHQARKRHGLRTSCMKDEYSSGSGDAQMKRS
jgi:hypothetical protein